MPRGWAPPLCIWLTDRIRIVWHVIHFKKERYLTVIDLQDDAIESEKSRITKIELQ